MISIIHPSRSRPQKSFDTVVNWTKNNCKCGIDKEVVVSLDSDDPYLSEYQRLFSAEIKSRYLDRVTLIINDNKSSVEAINRAVQYCKYDIFMVVSDDTEPVSCWDCKIGYEIVKDKTDFILKTQDGIQPWLITFPILDRAYYNRFGYVYYPGYKHMFCDTEITCVADITGRKITSNLLFPHKHYSVTKEQPDEINKKADATWTQGEKLFLERYARNFDLPKGNPIQDKGMIDWLQRKVR